MEYLIVDGYNVIGSWPELKSLGKGSLSDARHQLIEILKEYQAYTGLYIILVFDAYRSKGSKQTEQYPGLEVRYTEHGQTADSLIESLITKLASRKETMGVVTSDWAQQQIALGKGARRWSSREFYAEIQKITKLISRTAGQTKADRGTTDIKNRLDPKTWQALGSLVSKGKQSCQPT